MPTASDAATSAGILKRRFAPKRIGFSTRTYVAAASAMLAEHGRDAHAERRDAARADRRERKQRPVPEIERIADEADPDGDRLREHMAVEPAARARRDQKERAGRRRERPAARITELVVEQEHRNREQRGADPRQQICRRARHRAMARRARQRGEETADLQLPEPARRRIERGDRRMPDRREIDRERDEADGHDQWQRARAAISRTPRAAAARAGRTAPRCRATRGAAAASSPRTHRSSRPRSRARSSRRNPMPAAMCLPSAANSTGSSVSQPNA